MGGRRRAANEGVGTRYRERDGMDDLSEREGQHGTTSQWVLSRSEKSADWKTRVAVFLAFPDNRTYAFFLLLCHFDQSIINTRKLPVFYPPSSVIVWVVNPRNICNPEQNVQVSHESGRAPRGIGRQSRNGP
jgi:hypothetical protein